MSRKAGPGVDGSEAERLESAFRSHYHSLLRLAVLLTANRPEAEDLVQDTFVRSARRLGGVQLDGTERYLRTTLLNVWRNRIRRSRVERRHASADPPMTMDDPADPRALDMWEVIAALPPRQRACLVLRFYEDRSVEETARLLGCSQGTVKSQTHRALEKIRKVAER